MLDKISGEGGISNPRDGYRYAAFRVRCIQPLRHLGGAEGGTNARGHKIRRIFSRLWATCATGHRRLASRQALRLDSSAPSGHFWQHPDVDVSMQFLERGLDLIDARSVIKPKQAVHLLPMPAQSTRKLGTTNAGLADGRVKLHL
jgi:hypothetical protein